MTDKVSTQLAKDHACAVVDLCGNAGTLPAVIMMILYALGKKEGSVAMAGLKSACCLALDGDMDTALDVTNATVCVMNSNKGAANG